MYVCLSVCMYVCMIYVHIIDISWYYIYNIPTRSSLMFLFRQVKPRPERRPFRSRTLGRVSGPAFWFVFRRNDIGPSLETHGKSLENHRKIRAKSNRMNLMMRSFLLVKLLGKFHIEPDWVSGLSFSHDGGCAQVGHKRKDARVVIQFL